MKKIILSIAAFCLFNTAEAQLTTLNVGDVAPNFTVTDLHGVVHTKADYAGKYLLVDLFAYWCGPCADLAPTINSFYIKYGCNGYDMQVLAVEFEGTTAQTEAFETANGGDLTKPTPTVSGADGGGGAFHALYPVAGFPTFIIIGPDGLIKAIDIWPISDVATIEAAVTAAGGASVLVPHSCSFAEIDETSITNTKLFPNPSTGIMSYEFEGNKTEKISINVLNIVGQTIYNKEFESNNGQNKVDFNFAELQSGSYFFKVTNAEGKSTTQPFQIK